MMEGAGETIPAFTVLPHSQGGSSRLVSWNRAAASMVERAENLLSISTGGVVLCDDSKAQNILCTDSVSVKKKSHVLHRSDSQTAQEDGLLGNSWIAFHCIGFSTLRSLNHFQSRNILFIFKNYNLSFLKAHY